MSVTSANETWAREGGDERGVTRYTRGFLVVVSAKTDDSTVVLPACGISIGLSHPNDANAFCISRSARNDPKHWSVWHCTFEYSSERELQDNPLNEPARITWSGEPWQKAVTKDRDGDAVVNAAGDAFDPPPTVDDHRSVVTVVKNVASVPSWIKGFRNAINSDPFTVDGVAVGAEEAKVSFIGVSERQVRNDISFRTLTIPIHLNEDGWKLEILNQGMRCKPAIGSPERIRCIDGTGGAAMSPMLLDINGLQISDPKANNAVYLEFDVFKLKTFSTLPLA